MLLYALSGLPGNLVSLALHGNQAVSGGASGAIFSLYGALLVFLWREQSNVEPGEFRWLFGGAVVFSSLMLGVGFVVQGIDNAAHGGSLVGPHWSKCAATHRPGGTERLALWPCPLQRVTMVSIADVIPLSNGKRAPVLLVDWKLVGITQPEPQMPVPEIPPPLPPEMPQPLEPLGAPPPTENPVPMREPPMTLPPQS